jgi:hypothetical protein
MKRQPWRMNFFNNIIGTVKPRQHGLDFDFLDLPSVALDDLAAPFTVKEIEKIVKDLPSDKAPGPDSFTGLFLKVVGRLSNLMC